MSRPNSQKVVALAYRAEEFRFRVTKQSEDILRGFFLWTEIEKGRLHEMMTRDDDEDWFLDNNGLRLAENELLDKTPWSLIDGPICIKGVLRFIDWNTGEAWFCLTPWVRIGVEYDHPPPD